MRRVTDRERRARLATRHLLAERGGGPADIAKALLALHSSDPVTVFLSIRARSPQTTVNEVESALYDERSLIRFYGMRRTLWVIERELVAAVHHSTTKRLGERERTRTIRFIEEGGVTDDGAAWLDHYASLLVEVLRDRGQTLGRDLTRAIPGLEQKITVRNKAGRVMGTIGMTTRLLTQLALESRVIRGRPTGSWVSGQYRWAAAEDWLGGPIEAGQEDLASAVVVDRWLRVFGPGTRTDLRWWTGWSAGQVDRALDRVGAVEVMLEDGAVALLHPEDMETVTPPGRWVAILPSLDPTTMGWKARHWYIGDHEKLLFDGNGNAGQTVWLDGQVVGGWAQSSSGQLRHRLLGEVDAEGRGMIEAELGSLETWLAGTKVIPRFRSPHDRELAAGD